MPPRESVFLASPIASGRGGVIVSPFQFILTGDDHLRVEGWNAVSGAALEVSYRFADLEGRITVQRHVLTLTADRAATEQDFVLPEGYLVNLCVFVIGATPKIGETFCCLKLIRGFTGATIVLGLLLQGYVTHEQGLAWPGSPIADSISGGGVIRSLGGTDPAPGLELTEVVPTGARWQLLLFGATLVTSATVNNRRPALALDDGTSVWVASPVPGTVPASSSQRFGWALGLPVTALLGVTHIIAGLPTDTILLAGQRIKTDTENFAAGDNWGADVFQVREWLEAD